MCESFRPGMTVRLPQSITFVAGPRCRRISSAEPTALILPSLIASASTNDGTPFVAILALCNIQSGSMRGSLLDLSQRHPAPAAIYVHQPATVLRTQGTLLATRRG